MHWPIYPLTIITVFISAHSFADTSNATFTYRDDTKTFIPGSHDIKNNLTVDAPIGDNGLMSPIIKIKINGHGPYNFLFDTGFSRSMISNALAEKLQLTKIDTEKVTATTPTQVVNTFQHRYLVEKLQIGDAVIRDYGMVASSGFEDDVQDLKRLKVDGVLSANAFYGLLLTLDYKNEKIHIQNGDLLQESNETIPYAHTSDVPIINIKLKFDKLKKDVEQTAIIDTGFGAYFFINACNIPEMLNFRGQENLIAYDYLGYEQTKYFAQMYGDIIISDKYIINSPYITFGKVNCELENPHGLIGRTFFEKYKVTIDQKNRLIKITKY